MALGYVVEFLEDPTAVAPASYWNGRAETIDATHTALQEADTYIDGELNEVDLMTLLGNIQISHPDKYARLRRVDVTVALV
jgi:hypothetical protein